MRSRSPPLKGRGRGGVSNILRANDIQTPPLTPPRKGRVQEGKGCAVFHDNIGFRSRLIDSYLEGCKADGVEPVKPYSGKLNLRMSSELHSRVAAFVATTGTTINDFINRAITNELKKAAAL